MNGFEILFPRLQRPDYQVTSPPDRRYNCVAWVVGDPTDWWWPGAPERSFWPPRIPRVVTLEAFQNLFTALGYVVCDSEDYEAGFEKMALFAVADGTPQHAARQLPNGRWTSKLGNAEDIEHPLHALQGDLYGSVVLIMKRPSSG